jgi:hypothetical protein
MNPAHILLFLFLIAIIPFFAGAFLLAILSMFDSENLNLEDDNEED